MREQDRYTYHTIELPSFPHMLLPMARRKEDGLLFFPVKAVCLGLKLDYKTQREKVNTGSKYTQYREMVPFETTTGFRGMLCLEFEGLGQLLTGIQERRVGDPQQQENLSRFRRDVVRSVNEILAGLRKSAERVPALPSGHSSADDLRALVLFQEQRISEQERKTAQLQMAIFVNADDDDTQSPASAVNVATRSARCPHCGGPIVIEGVQFRVVAAASDQPEDEDA